MKFAARRIWPEKSQAWEYLGEAEGIDDFALMFATDKGLAVGDEFVVIEKAGADSDIEFFKVSRAAPYAVMPADPRVESQSAQPSAEDEPTQDAHSIGEVWRAMFGNAFFFIKVTGTAFAFFLALIFIARYFGAW